jgi:DNA polymerase-1
MYRVTQNLLIVDGNNIASRAYFTNRLGFYRMVLEVVQDVDPDYFAIVFDAPGLTWRHELYDKYKENKQYDEDRQAYITAIRESFEGLMPVYYKSGHEADDIIATLSLWSALGKMGVEGWEIPNRHCYILSNDNDLLALVGERVSVIAPTTSFKDRITHTPQSVYEKLGVWPHQIYAYKALVGDGSDNIPGVYHVGKVTACKLLAKHGSKVSILNAIADANWDKKPRWANLIEADMSNFELSYSLVELRFPEIADPILTSFQGQDVIYEALKKYESTLQSPELLGFISSAELGEISARRDEDVSE